MPALHALLKRLRAAAPVLILAACAHPVPATPPSPYLPPTASTASARLLMRNALAGPDTYEVNVFDDAEACAGRRRVGTGGPAVDPPATAIAAGRWQTIEVVVRKPDRMVCPIRWSFAPVAGRTYLVSTASKAGGCTMAILDATNPDAIKVEPTLHRRNVGANVCVPLAQTTAIRLNDPHGGDDTSDLPIGPDTRTPAAPLPPKSPPPKAPATKRPDPVTTDDLQGLIGH